MAAANYSTMPKRRIRQDFLPMPMGRHRQCLDPFVERCHRLGAPYCMVTCKPLNLQPDTNIFCDSGLKPGTIGAWYAQPLPPILLRCYSHLDRVDGTRQFRFFLVVGYHFNVGCLPYLGSIAILSNREQTITSALQGTALGTPCAAESHCWEPQHPRDQPC